MPYLVKSNYDIDNQVRNLTNFLDGKSEESSDVLSKLLQTYYDHGLKFISHSPYGYVFEVIPNPMVCDLNREPVYQETRS